MPVVDPISNITGSGDAVIDNISPPLYLVGNLLYLQDGYFSTPIIHVTADVDALMGQYIFEVDTTLNDIIIKLPSLSTKPSDITSFTMEFRFLVQGGANTLTLLADSSDEMINPTAPSINSYTTSSLGDIILMKYCANNGSPIWIREV